MPLVNMSDEDIKTLRKMAIEYRQKTPKTTGKIIQKTGNSITTEVYLARPLSGSTIPAFNAAAQTPGRAEADIFRPGGINGDGVPLDLSFKKWILNYSTSEVADGSFTPVFKEKFGKWVVASPGAVSGSTTCSTVRDVYGMPTSGASPPLRYVGTSGSDGVCDFVEILECGMNATPPCSGCTGESPSFQLMKISGVTLVAIVPPENSFDRPAGDEVLLSRSSRCGYSGSFLYYESGDTIGVDAPETMDVNLDYDSATLKWFLKFTDPIADTMDFVKKTGPHDCTTLKTYTLDVDNINLPGYVMTSISVTITPR